MRHILCLVTGMTPQIITETVWALACDPDNDSPWVPDEIHVLSTDDGLNQIRSRLFSEKEGFKFAKFQKEYPQLANIHFDGSDKYLHVITDPDGNILKDLKTPDDNELAANLICQMVRQFTERDDVALHVSIAGGRKTMGFYAGYALSLYGRAQDKMSHVLVDERYESARDFFYPSVSDDVFVTNRDGVELRTKDAQIWLANIPFVRMRDAISHRHQLKSDDSFSQVVQKINQSYQDVRLVIDLAKQIVVVNNTFEVKLPPREFALLHWFADLRKNNQAGIVAPTKKWKNANKDEKDSIDELTDEFNQYYADVKQVNEDLRVDKAFFEPVKSRLKESLDTQLGLELSAKIAIVQDKRGMPFYLGIEPNAINIVDSFKD